MKHLEWHEHAFIKDNKVINIAVFKEEDHDSQLLQDVKESLYATEVISCCEYGIAYLNGTWDGKKFWPPQPFPSWIKRKGKWEAPTPMPTDDKPYFWNEPTLSWIEVAP